MYIIFCMMIIIVTSNFSISHNFYFTIYGTYFKCTLNCRLQFVSIWTSLTFSSGNGLTLYHTVLTFNDPWKRSLLKTLWEMEKMLVISIFSISHVFSPSQSKFNFSAKFNLSSANAFNLDQPKILSFGQELMHLSDALHRARRHPVMEP